MFFDSININIPKENVYLRLGFANGITTLEDKQKSLIQAYLDEAEALFRLKGAGERIKIISRSDDEVVLDAGVSFKSVNLSKILAGCDEVLLVAATAGSEILKTIEKDSQEENLTRAVVLDAAASETADECLGWIINFFNTALRREGKVVTRKRFSAGFGDFELDNQKRIFDILALDKIGISITDEFILVPEKSVTAVCGIHDIEI